MAKGITLQELDASAIVNLVPHLGTTSNIGDAYSVTTPVTIGFNQKFTIKFNAASSSAPKLRINNGTEFPIIKPNGNNARIYPSVYSLFWDGTNFILQGEGGGLDESFGDGSDGALNTTGNVTFTVDAEDVTTVVKQYTSITINSGHTLSVDKRCRGLILYCTGDVIINGTIDMTGKSAFVNPLSNDPIILPLAVETLLAYDPTKNKFYSTPRGGSGGAGGSGGSAVSTSGAAGGAGGGGNLFGGGQGGGGAGGSASITSNPGGYATGSLGGNGGTGSSGPAGAGGSSVVALYDGDFNFKWLSGRNGGVGAGGSGAACNRAVPQNYSSGKGGSGVNGGGASGGGGVAGESGMGNSGPLTAGNGVDGTNIGGGLVLIIAKGNITISSTGKILSNGLNNGQNGGYATYLSGTYCGAGSGGGGGGAGGGLIISLHRGIYKNSGILQVNGTNGGSAGGGTYSGGAGGAGLIGVITERKI
ncbi:hypothetical protein [Paenibacillus sp. PSB04]|uniref:hypothetical protein n=1 Tax=Paenibacillus sp. PSB04 TaxID=2866810 RepID=UPI0021F0BD51|nr:hypothetical protein [Paenibacillus sp. PSB04]UYO04899.1 hypothetical protein K2F33_02515 [Paenibacillus sp. PSB04]